MDRPLRDPGTLRIQPETTGARFARGARERVLVRERPGISPRVFAEHLLARSAFVELRDLALDLPPLTEEAHLVEPDPALREACQALERDLRAGVRRALRGSRMLALGRYLHTLLAFPDHPDGFGPLYDPDDPSRVLAVPPRLPLDHAYAKDRALIALVQAERAEGRRVLVYTTASHRPDAVGRSVRLLRAHGVWAEALRAELAPEQRERWLARQVDRGVEALVCHPALIGTGLDLVEWPTVVWMLPSWSVYTVRQASRRAYRVGQTRPVHVVFLGYAQTLQARLLGLLGSKIEASLALEGQFQAHGLLALADPGDLGTALARSLVDGLQGLDSAEAIWRRLAPPAAPRPPAAPTPPAAAPEHPPLTAPAPVAVTTRDGRRHRERLVRPDELEEAVGQLGFAWRLPEPSRA